MTYTAEASNYLTNLMQAGYEDIGDWLIVTLTGGTTLTLIDTKHIGSQETTEGWKNGTAFFIRTTDNLAPEGEFRRISTYDDATGTWTVDAVFSVTPTAGDIVGLASADVPYERMVELINKALKNLPDVPVGADTTTLDTASQKTEYAQALLWKNNLIEIWESQDTDTNDRQWEMIESFWEIPADPGSAGTLVLPQLESGNDLMFIFMRTHPVVSAYDDVISEYLPWQLIRAKLNETIWDWLVKDGGGKNDNHKLQWSIARDDYQKAKVENPIDFRLPTMPHLVLPYDADVNIYPMGE